MSYHDQPPPSLKFGDDSKKNYYDELNFWLSRSKNLETLLIEAIGHIEDFELMMRMVRDAGLEGDNFDEEHLQALQKFLTIAGKTIGDKSSR